MKDFVVRQYRIPLDHSRFPLCGPVKVALLSDLHGAWYGPGQEALAEEIRFQEPDLIISAGDLVTRGESAEAALALFTALDGEFPVFCGNGNHESRIGVSREEREEYLSYCRALRQMGIRILENQAVRLAVRGLPMEITGLEVGREHYRRVGAAKVTGEELDRLLPPSSGEGYRLLIAHDPTHFEAYANWGAGLVLSGHLHGGFIRLPLVGGLVSPQLRPFPKYDQGEFTLGKSHMVVSAGLGEHHIPFRFWNPRELPIICLYDPQGKYEQNGV